MRQSKDNKKAKAVQPKALIKVGSSPKPAVQDSPLKAAPRPTLVCLGHLRHGENARQHYKKEDIAELAASLQSKGLLQNLVGYPEGEHIEVSAGHRRLEALLLLVSQKAVGQDGRPFDANYEVPVLLKPKTEALEDSLIENLQREQMHPLEEARAFHRLTTQYSYTPEEIAERTGKTLASVKKRLHLATTLCDQGCKLFAEDELTLTQAQALAALSKEAQKRLLKQYGTHFDARVITQLLKQQTLEVAKATFKLEDYRKAGGVIVEDLYNQISAYFANPDLAKRLQMEAAEAQVERLQQKWAWAKLVSNVNLWEYIGSNDKKKAGAFVVVHPSTLEVTIHEGLLERPRTPAQRTPTTRKRGPITKGGVVLTKARKTGAMQVALLGHPNSFQCALALNVLGLLGNSEVFLGFSNTAESRWEKLYVHPQVQAIFAEVAPTLKLTYKEGRLEGKQSHLLNHLLSLSQATLERLFTALSATAIGTWVGQRSLEPADSPLALKMAQHLGARVDQDEVNDAWLKTLSKERLMEIHKEMGMALVGEFTAKQLRGLILERLKRNPEYLPKELSFHPQTAMAQSPTQQPEELEEVPDEVLEEEERRELVEEENREDEEYLEELEAA